MTSRPISSRGWKGVDPNPECPVHRPAIQFLEGKSQRGDDAFRGRRRRRITGVGRDRSSEQSDDPCSDRSFHNLNEGARASSTYTRSSRSRSSHRPRATEGGFRRRPRVPLRMLLFRRDRTSYSRMPPHSCSTRTTPRPLRARGRQRDLSGCSSRSFFCSSRFFALERFDLTYRPRPRERYPLAGPMVHSTTIEQAHTIKRPLLADDSKNEATSHRSHLEVLRWCSSPAKESHR